ncbi:MAG TPA: hypothetical protein VMO00_09670 [Methylomirabilota bacterium]|nr:hypothetical protein [Methylomirabilota bacterium]
MDSFVLGLQYDEQICQRRLARLRLGENHLELLRAQELDYTMTTGIDGKGTGLLYILITIVFAFVVMPSQPVFAQERLDSVGLKITRSLSDSSTVLKLDARLGDPCEDGFLLAEPRWRTYIASEGEQSTGTWFAHTWYALNCGTP